MLFWLLVASSFAVVPNICANCPANSPGTECFTFHADQNGNPTILACFPKQNGVCPPQTVPCGSPLPVGQGVCAACGLNSQGFDCWAIQAGGNIACFAFTPAGQCPPQTTPCTPLQLQGICTLCPIHSQGFACWGRNAAGQVACYSLTPAGTCPPQTQSCTAPAPIRTGPCAQCGLNSNGFDCFGTLAGGSTACYAFVSPGVCPPQTSPCPQPVIGVPCADCPPGSEGFQCAGFLTDVNGQPTILRCFNKLANGQCPANTFPCTVA